MMGSKGGKRRVPSWLMCFLLLTWWMACEGQAPAPALAAPKLVAPGVWFLEGDAHAGDCNSILIEMRDYLVLVDPSYPSRTRELMALIPGLSGKPVRYVFDTHAHGDHSYGNVLWTRAGATTVAYAGVREEMSRYEPVRWQAASAKWADIRELDEPSVEPPKLVFHGEKMVLRDAKREVDLLFLGWGHTHGDGWVWLPRERILCTGDAAVNGPRNKLWDADVANWPKVIDKAVALGPTTVLPGHGAAGGVEILTGQARFLRDLRAVVKKQRDAGVPLETIEKTLVMPTADANWVRPDMSQDVQIVYSELAAGKPAGALPHMWQ